MIKIMSIGLLLCAAMLPAEDAKPTAKNNDSSKTPATAAKRPASGPVVIPADAKEVEPYFFKWTDPADGKKWMFYKGPFGITKYEDKPAPEVRYVTDQTSPIVGREDGDTIHFDWDTPLGHQHWTRKRSELSANEKAVLEYQKKQAAAKAEPAKADPKN